MNSLVRVIRGLGGGDVVQHIVGAAPGQGQPGQDAGDPGAVLRCGELRLGQDAVDLVGGEVDDALMVALAVGQHGLEGLVVLVAGLLDEGGDGGDTLRGDARNGQVVPLHVLQHRQCGHIVGVLQAHAVDDHPVGDSLIDQLQVIVIALGPLGEVHLGDGVVDGQRFAALGLIVQNDRHNPALTALDSGQALGLERDQDFGQAHNITTFLLKSVSRWCPAFPCMAAAAAPGCCPGMPG